MKTLIVNNIASRGKQQGLSLLGLVALAAIAFGISALGMKSFPAFMEYQAVKKAVMKVKDSGSTPNEVMANFDKAAQIDDISSIAGRDLTVVKSNGGGFDVSFAYDKKVPLIGPASLLFEFQGSSKKQ
jgi:Domain of unknown function (DUF4845)